MLGSLLIVSCPDLPRAHCKHAKPEGWGRVLLLQCEILSELLREDHACSLKLNLAGVRGISNQRLPP